MRMRGRTLIFSRQRHPVRRLTLGVEAGLDIGQVPDSRGAGVAPKSSRPPAAFLFYSKPRDLKK